MKKLPFLLILCNLIFVSLLYAQTPVDSQVASALADISKYESQFAGQTTANPSSINRTLKLLGLTRQRLDSSANQTDPSWIEADTRYKALVEQLNGMLSPATVEPAAAADAAAPATAPAAISSPAPAIAPAGSPAPQMISQQRVRIQKMARDIESRLQTMNQNGVKPFQSPEYVDNYQKSLDNFKLALGKYAEFPNDPDVITAGEKLVEFENMMVFGRQQAAKDTAELGNVQVRLAEINQGMHQIKVPATPQEPYQRGQLDQWLSDLISARNAALALSESLPLIKEKAYLPDDRLTPESGGAYDLQDVDRLQRSFTGTVESIDSAVHAFTDHLLLVVSSVEQDLTYYKEYDPTDPNQQSNHFLSEGRADEVRAELAQDYLTVSEAASYAQRLNHDTYAGRVAVLEQVQATMDQYETNYAKALELVRMPKAASTDSDLEEIAEDTLANYDDVGDIQRLVINADKRHLSKETSESKFDDIDVSLSGEVTLTGTKTTYFFEWDEFQVATAEPVGDTYYIFYSTLKYFTSGSETTPLNKWIIARRFQGSEIPKANINKN